MICFRHSNMFQHWFYTGPELSLLYTCHISGSRYICYVLVEA